MIVARVCRAVSIRHKRLIDKERLRRAQFDGPVKHPRLDHIDPTRMTRLLDATACAVSMLSSESKRRAQHVIANGRLGAPYSSGLSRGSSVDLMPHIASDRPAGPAHGRVATPLNAHFPPPRPRSFCVPIGAVSNTPQTGPGPRPACDIDRLPAGAIWCTFGAPRGAGARSSFTREFQRRSGRDRARNIVAPMVTRSWSGDRLGAPYSAAREIRSSVVPACPDASDHPGRAACPAPTASTLRPRKTR